jgi:hypothetical protein
MPFKKILTNITIIIIVTFILDFSIGKTLHHFYFRQTSGVYFRTTYSMEKTRADVLIFGASEALHHYATKIFEDSLKMTCYNTGRDACGIFFQVAVLKSVLKRYKPKIIILDYSDNFRSQQIDYDRLSYLLPYYETHKEIREIVFLKSPFERLKLLSEIYPFNSQILTIIIGNLEINKSRAIVEKGFIPFIGKWNANIDSMEINTNYKTDSNKINSFKEFLKLSKDAGIKIFVIHSPVFRVYKGKYGNKICNDICNSVNVPYWDYSKDTFFLNNNYLFYEVDYLNNKGSYVFSSSIALKIKKNLDKK